MSIEHPGGEAIMAWLDGELPTAEATAIRAHVDGCESCQASAAAHSRLRSRLGLWRVGDVPPGLAQPPAGRVTSSRRWRWGIAAAAALVVTAGAAWWPSLCAVYCAAPVTVTESRRAAPALSVAPRGAARGDEAVVIVEFVDWQCPSCSAAYYAYKPILDRFAQQAPGKVSFVTKDFPLDSECNPHVTVQMHRAACAAAVAVRLAREHGQADVMIDWLFANQRTLTREAVIDAAGSLLGVDASRWPAEYDRLLPDVRRDTDEGAQVNIRFTPTFFLNGRLLEEGEGKWLSPDAFERAIASQLNGAGGAPAEGRRP
jgi:protein-disulfide isomerase